MGSVKIRGIIGSYIDILRINKNRKESIRTDKKGIEKNR